MPRNVFAILLTLGSFAAPVFANTLYLPLVATEVEGIPYETRISITNPEFGDAQYTPYFIPLGTDGTVRNGPEPSTVLIVGQQTVPTSWAPGALGMLEIDSDAQLIYYARLIGDLGNVETSGTEIPVVSADNAVPSGQTVFLQTWERSETVMTDFGLMNLSKRDSACLIGVTRRGGLTLLSDFPVTLAPLSILHVNDALELLDELTASEIRVSVTCDQLFYTYAATFDRDTGEARFIAPSTPGAAGLILSDIPDCTPGAICFEEPGLFHAPVPGNPVLTKTMMTPFGQYRRIRVRLTIVNGGWANNASGSHNIFWLVRNVNRDLVGYVNVRGGNKNDAFVRHGFGQRHNQKPRMDTGFNMQTGIPYQFDYIYDTEARSIALTITDPAGQVRQTFGVPDINVINFEQGHQWLMEFGLRGLAPNEPPTFGWLYRDLLVEFVP